MALPLPKASATPHQEVFPEPIGSPVRKESPG